MTPTALIKQAQQLFHVRVDWLGEGGLPSPHAAARIQRCLACPKHDTTHAWEEFYKGVVAHRIRRQMELKSRMQWNAPEEEKLHLCGVCRCILKLKVFVPLHITRADTPDWQNMPENCWMRDDDLI
jgi:hypothetical protein